MSLNDMIICNHIQSSLFVKCHQFNDKCNNVAKIVLNKVAQYSRLPYLCVTKPEKMTNLTALTQEQTKRVNNDLNETKILLNKELSYSSDLQNSNRIDQLKSHITKLNNMLSNGWNAPKFN